MGLWECPRPHSVDKIEESGNNAMDTSVQYAPINAAVTSEININNCACVLLNAPIGAHSSPATYTVAGLIALPSTYSSSSQSWLVGSKATASGFVETHKTSVQCCSHSASVLQRKDEFHHPIGCPWPEIRLDISGCSLAVASFPGPAQLFVACSTEKRGEPGIFSHVSMT